VAVIVLTAIMGKDGAFSGGRLTDGKVSYNAMFLALECAPIVAIAALCVLRRPNSALAKVGLFACAISAGVSVWGAIADYMAWSERPPPTDQITYLGWFFGMLGSWAVYLAYGVVGWVLRRRDGGSAVRST